MNGALVDHAAHIDSSRALNVVVGRHLDSTVGEVDLPTRNPQTTTRDLVDLAQQAGSNDAFLKGQIKAAVQLLGVEMDKLNGSWAKDLDALTKALDVQVRVMQGDIAALRAETALRAAGPPAAGNVLHGFASVAQLQEPERQVRQITVVVTALNDAAGSAPAPPPHGHAGRSSFHSCRAS